MSLQLKTIDGKEVVVKTVKHGKTTKEVLARMTVEQFKEREILMQKQDIAAKERKVYLDLVAERQSLLNKEDEKVRKAVSNFLHNDQATLRRGMELLKQFLEG
jgi:hypothetical protein